MDAYQIPAQKKSCWVASQVRFTEIILSGLLPALAWSFVIELAGHQKAGLMQHVRTALQSHTWLMCSSILIPFLPTIQCGFSLGHVWFMTIACN